MAQAVCPAASVMMVQDGDVLRAEVGDVHPPVGTDVEGAKPFYEIVEDQPKGDITHDRTKQVIPPAFPYPAKVEAPKDAPRRERLAAWITSKDNQYFAKSYVSTQLSQPGRVRDVGLAAGHIADVAGVDQNHVQCIVEQKVERLPVRRGRLDHHTRHPLSDQMLP